MQQIGVVGQVAAASPGGATLAVAEHDALSARARARARAAPRAGRRRRLVGGGPHHGRQRSTMTGARPRLISSTSSSRGRGRAHGRWRASAAHRPRAARPGGRGAAQRREPGHHLGPGNPSPRGEPQVLRAPSRPGNSERFSVTKASPARVAVRVRVSTGGRRAARPPRPAPAGDPATVSSVVVLPAPLGPRSATTSPPRPAARGHARPGAAVAGAAPRARAARSRAAPGSRDRRPRRRSRGGSHRVCRSPGGRRGR